MSMSKLKRPRRSLSISSCSSTASFAHVAQKPRVEREWPAPTSALTAARSFLRECAQTSSRTLLVPDKDADGLSSCAILYRALLLLGHSPSTILVHLLSKGSNPHLPAERDRMKVYNAEYAVVMDHGSRAGPPIVPPRENGEKVRTLLVDHHLSDEFPDDTLVLSACKHEPVATSSALAYVLCLPLHPSVAEQCDYLCAMGTHGDLGTSFPWTEPWPDMKACFKTYTKKAVNDAVSLVNAPRRTATFDVASAWEAVRDSTSPSSLLSHPRLLAARQEVNAEVSRCARSAPTFSADGKIALIRMKSGAQVHPVIATRWANSLKGKSLELVIAANDGYLPNKTNFAVRIARCYTARLAASATSAAAKQANAGAFVAFVKSPAKPKADNLKPVEVDMEDISIPEILRGFAARVPGLLEEMGEDFARGHKQASGGIVGHEAFEKLWAVMNEGEVNRDGKTGKNEGKIGTGGGQQGALDKWVKR